MRLVRYGEVGQERPALLDENGKLRDLSNYIPDLTGEFLSQHSFDDLGKIDPGDLPIIAGPVRLGPCVGASFRLIGIGLNYADHAAESGEDIPAEPIVFIKSTEVSGPNDPIVIPRGSTKTDWEVELGVVIGRRARYVDQEEALSCVAGYCVAHDVSERHWQIERGGQWTKGKSADSFAPIGPWLVTKDEISDPHSLRIWLEVNGHRYQNSSTSQMFFGVEHLVSYLSEIFTLRPGDVIFTGTPSGVGLRQKPEPRYLQPGDTVRLGIEGLGIQEQQVIPFGA